MGKILPNTLTKTPDTPQADDLELQLAKYALLGLLILWFVLPFLVSNPGPTL